MAACYLKNVRPGIVLPRFCFALTLLTTITCIETIRAQDTVLTVQYNSRLDSINSDILKQKRYIQVFTPLEFKPGAGDKYDVLYVLDGGNWNTGLIRQIQRFIQNEGNMPPTIIVSVMGIDRNIELTPTHLSTWNAPTGGADRFLGFIKNELIPYVNKLYPSNGHNTLWGHSLGGMFVIYSMLNEPASFKSYIAVDPSLWWDGGFVTKMAAGKLPALAGQHITLFIAGREGGALHGMNIDSMELVLKKMAPADLIWKLTAYPEESHSSVRFKSTYDGLRFTYAGLAAAIEFHPMNGIVMTDKPFTIWSSDDTTRLRYTLDGTTPTESSDRVHPEITVTGPARVTYKLFTNRSDYDKTISGNFTAEKMSAPVSKPKNSKPGGLTYAYYEGNLEKWPDLRGLKPLKTGTTSQGFEASLPRKNDYALVIDGFLEIREDGYYVFFGRAAENSTISLGDKLLMRWDGSHPFYSYLVPLSRGFYPLKMQYLEKKGEFKLALYYITPAIMKTKDPVPIPIETLYSDGKK